MRRTVIFMLGLMVVLGGCSQETSENDKSKIEYSKQENLKEEPDEITNEVVEEEIMPPEYYLEMWEKDRAKLEVVYNEKYMQFEITWLNAEKLARVVKSAEIGNRSTIEQWEKVVEAHRNTSDMMEDEYSIAINHPSEPGYLLIVQGGEVVYNFMDE